MLIKSIKFLMFNYSGIKILTSRRFSSALYITGEKAQKTFAYVNPTLDFEERLENKAALEKNLKLRRLNVDLAKIERRWKFFQHLYEQKLVLETTKSVMANEIAKLTNVESRNEEDLEKLKLHLKLAKEDLNVLRDYFYGVEEGVALQVLSLPNILHEKTPHEEENVEYQFLNKPQLTESRSHIEIGRENDLIEITDPSFYFLKNDGALFELSVIDYASRVLLSSSFTQFSNGDFSRSVIVEGCGTDFLDKLEVFTLEETHTDKSNELTRLHLTGGASLYSFMAYFSRNLIQTSYFPLKYFTSGRQYKPTSSKELSLLNVNQETALDIFIAIMDDNEEENQFNELISSIIKIYEPLGKHFRLIYLPAHKLKASESLRLSIQMFSCSLQNYVEVGHVSLFDSYLSKRLLFTYSVDHERRFPKVISGSLIRVQPLLACMLEYDKNVLPNVLMDYIIVKDL